MIDKPKRGEKLTFGFDIGIASVGWCVLASEQQYLVDLGVRCFDKAETERGESLNLARRTARLMRRRLRRRAWRLTKLGRLLKGVGLIDDANYFSQRFESVKTPWELRVEGLDRQLTNQEWARVIYHLCKHRGFYWVSQAEEKKATTEAEGGKVKQGLTNTQKLMRSKGYRSIAEMMTTEFPKGQRNKQGDYSKALPRVMLGTELLLLFERQRVLGNPFADTKLETALLGSGDRKNGLFWEQKPPLAGADLLKMLGKCTFEQEEYRAPKANFTAERHVWLTRLNNLRIVVQGQARSLNETERQVALPLPYQQAGDLTYKQLRTAWHKTGLLTDDFLFAGLSYPTATQEAEGKTKDPEAQKLISVPAWQTLSKVLKTHGLVTEWQGMAGAATGGRPEQLDQIALILSVFKDDEEVTRELKKLALPGGERMIAALSEISFDKFHALSLKALRKIVPYMESGLRYDEACLKAGYQHSAMNNERGRKQKYLPPFYIGRDHDGRLLLNNDADIPRNPVVLRALNQARKVLNALVRRYGSPSAVHIEMARDLSRPLDERQKIKKAQDEFRERNEKIKAEFESDHGFVAKSRELEKYQLYREQHGKCAYSLEPLDLSLVLSDPEYVQIDHALPYSRSYDNSKNNKVLVLSSENQNKGNRTAYEYLTSFPGGEESERWQRYFMYVESNKQYRLAKRSRLLRKDFSKAAAEGFRDRNLNDTRYICRFFKNYVEQHLLLADDNHKKHCVVLSGQLTAFLRARWGFEKVRGESDRHHALDAAIVAACSASLVKRLSDYSRRKELKNARDVIDADTGEIVDRVQLAKLEAHFPKPWEHFREELLLRLNVDDPLVLKSEAARFGYPAAFTETLKPLFVSRAPQRRNGGAAHKDTIYSQPERLKAEGSVTQKVPLSSLSGKDVDRLIDPHRNEKLYAAIRARLEAHGGKGDKAFTADQPLYKPDRNGEPTGPMVRSVTLIIDKLSGIPIRGGIAKNDTMLRVDVFRHPKDKKYHLVPVYVHHSVAKDLPKRAIVAFKDEKDWTLIDDSFDFQFSLYPNDLIRITQKNKPSILGYYGSCHRGTGNINIWLHDRNQAGGKKGAIEGIGVKTALSLEKFNVDVLGNIYPAMPEVRHGLA